MSEAECFGFYLGGPVCRDCQAEKRCKAVLISDGFDIAAAVLERAMAGLSPKTQFRDTDQLGELVAQIFETPSDLTSEEVDILKVLDQETINPNGAST